MSDQAYFIWAMLFDHFFKIVAGIAIIVLVSCKHPAIQEAEDRQRAIQEQVISAPVDMSHCEGNTITIVKLKCGGEK